MFTFTVHDPQLKTNLGALERVWPSALFNR